MTCGIARAEPGWFTVKVGLDVPPSLAVFYLFDLGEIAGVLGRMLVLLGDAGRGVTVCTLVGSNVQRPDAWNQVLRTRAASSARFVP